jgi:hypothetical protein
VSITAGFCRRTTEWSSRGSEEELPADLALENGQEWTFLTLVKRTVFVTVILLVSVAKLAAFECFCFVVAVDVTVS